jgi:hypothetical protein
LRDILRDEDPISIRCLRNYAESQIWSSIVASYSLFCSLWNFSFEWFFTSCDVTINKGCWFFIQPSLIW